MAGHRPIAPNGAHAPVRALVPYFKDLKAGFIIFLIALPLSVGIALASGAPASAGLLAAIVGGVLGSLLGGSELTINGPAAGLIVVVLGAVESLGQGDTLTGFRYALAAMIAAGALQVVMGLFGLASLGLAFPSAVIHGMLSAIGAIIIIKQVPVLLGVKPMAKSIFGMMLEIPRDVANLNPEVAFIGIASVFIMFIGPSLAPRLTKKLPLPLVVVCLGIFLSRYFDLEHHHSVQFLFWKSEISPGYLLNVPSRLAESIVYPDFGRFFSIANLAAVFSISIIASIESVLSTFAVDKLDPLRRTSDLNRDLWSKGICNILLGFIGGLPIISEIVRSSANIENGANSRRANFFHGLFILAFLMAFPGLLHSIPLAALAAILIFVGWRLAHPSQFKHAVHIGPDHIAAFLVTFLTTLATDLLIGVVVGVAAELLIAVFHRVSAKDLVRLRYETAIEGESATIVVLSPLVFSNSLRLRAMLMKNLEEKRNVVLNLTRSAFIDHTVMDQLNRMKDSFESAGLKIKQVFCESHLPISEHPLAARKRGQR